MVNRVRSWKLADIYAFCSEISNLKVKHIKIVTDQKKMKVFSRVEISLLFYGFELDWGAHGKFFLFFKIDAVLHLSLDNSWLGAKLNLVFIVLVIVEKFDQRVLHLNHAAQYHSKVDMELV